MLIDFTDVTTQIKPTITWDGYNPDTNPAHLVIWPKVVNPTLDDLRIINSAATYQSVTCYAYYTGNNTKTLKMNDTNAGRNLGTIVTCLNTLLTTKDLDFEAMEFAYGYDGTNYVYTDVSSTFISNVGQLPVVSLNLCGCNLSSLGKNLSGLNDATKYIIFPVNNDVRNAAEDFDTYIWNNNVCVVAAYVSKNKPFGTGGNMGGANYSVNNDPSPVNDITITYLRKTNTLAGGAPYLPAAMQNAEKMVMVGVIGNEDLEAINHMTCSYVDLNKATFAEGVSIVNYSNATTQWLAVPNNTRREVVDDVYSSLVALNPNFIGVVGFTTEELAATDEYQTVPANTLITHTAQQGAVYNLVYKIEETNTGNYASGVNNIMMSGHLNAFDICNSTQGASGVGVELANDGHLYATGCTPEGATAYTGTTAGALDGATLSWVDFTNAIFDQPTEAELTANEKHCPQYFTADEKKALVTDMNFVALGCMPTDSLRLPVDQSQKVINAYSLSQLNGGSIQSLCIPSNFQYIMDGAFNRFDGTNLSHIYTDNTYGEDDLVNDVVDNGIGWCDVTVNGETSRVLKGSYTIASTVKYIARAAFDTNTTNGVADVYVLAKIAPVCEPYAFNSTKLIGNNGFKNYNPICRDNYYNGGWIAVLRFPNALDDDAKKLYTDIEREYFYVDETGAVDGDGNLMTWPNHSEFSRSWNQANLGYTWSDWDTTRNMPPYNENAGGVYGQMLVYGAWDGSFVTLPKKQDVPADATSYSTQATLDVTDQHADCNNCDFASHIGWHQFLLAQPGYFYEKQSEKYKQTPYYTFCIPFDMTYDELNKFLGSPEDSETGFKMPEVRTLRHVIRYPEATTVDGKKKKENLVSIIISKDLVANECDVKTYGQTNTKKEAELVSITRKKGDADVYVKGGYPYIVRGWIPEAETMPENLAKYVLAKGMDYFTAYDLGNVAYVSDGDTISTGLYNRTTESGFVAMPYFNHTVDAYDWKNQHFYGERDEANIKYKGKDGNTYDLDYKYNFCGRYESGKVFNPQYSYYMNSSGAFKRCTTPEDTKWDIYNCIITHHGEGMPLPILISEAYNWRSTYIKELNDHVWAGQYGEYDESEIGENESPESGPGETNFIVLFDEDIEGEMTDGIVNTEFIKSLAGDSKVYNINGQFVGTSINGLAKGVYVVNGRKFVVK